MEGEHSRVNLWSKIQQTTELEHVLYRPSLISERVPSFYGSLDVETQQHFMLQAWVHQVSS